MATSKELLGQVLEDFIKAILKSLFPQSEGYRVTFPDKTNYNNHNGVDFRVFNGKKEVLALECKNWRKQNFKYGSDTAQTEVIDRFRHVGTNLKILLISFLEVFYNPALNLIHDNRIKTLETQKLIGHKDFRSQLFYVLKSQIQKLLYEHQKRRSVFSTSLQSSNNTLVNYLVSKTTTQASNYIPTNNDTPREDTLSTNRRFPDRRRFIPEPRFS